MLTVPSTHRTGCCQGSALHPPSFIINTLEQGPGPVLSLSPMDCPSVIFIYICSSTKCSSMEPESLSSSTTWQTACFPSWAAFFSLGPRCRMSKIKFSVFPSGRWPAFLHGSSRAPQAPLPMCLFARPLSSTCPPHVLHPLPAHQPRSDPGEPIQGGCQRLPTCLPDL